MFKDDPTLEELKAGLDIVEYIGREVELKKRGKEYVGCCPIHREKTPSFYVNEHKQLFRCYGCGAAGSVLDFIMYMHDIDEGMAAKQIRAELGIDKGVPLLEVKRKLSKEQEKAEAYIDKCSLEMPSAALVKYGLMAQSAYENAAGDVVVPLRTKQALEDVMIVGNNRGKPLNGHINEGWRTIGKHNKHSQTLYLCTDYIDANYLHKNTGSNKLIVFSPWIHKAIERAKREHPDKEIRLLLPNTIEGEIILETWGGLYSMPEERGFWCEKSRQQQIKGFKRA